MVCWLCWAGAAGTKEDVGEDIDLQRELDRAGPDFSLWLGRNGAREDEQKTALRGLGLSC